MTIIGPDPEQGYGAGPASSKHKELESLEAEINAAIRATPVGQDVFVVVGIPTEKKRKGAIVFEGYKFDVIEQSVEECEAAGWARASIDLGRKNGVLCLLLRLAPPRPQALDPDAPRTAQGPKGKP